VIDRSLNLLIHRVFHLSLGMSAVAVKHHDQDQNGDDADDENVTKAVPMVTDVEHACFVVVLKVWVFQDWLANVGRVLEARADGIHDGLSFHLSAVRTVIDHDRGNYFTTMLVPIVDFILKDKEKWMEKATKNKIIEDEIDYWNKHGGNVIPSIVINNCTYRGQMETQAVMNAICAGFQDTPNICKPILEDPDLQDDYETGVFDISDHGYSFGHVLIICVVAILILVMVLYCYRRHAKRQMKDTMNKQIETAVNHYVSLSQSDSERKSTTS
jgi:hypothetical protein